LASHPLDLASVVAGIFDRAAPPPNQSTQCQPLSSANFLHEVDKVTFLSRQQIYEWRFNDIIH
jgi:hypothetical protein